MEAFKGQYELLCSSQNLLFNEKLNFTKTSFIQFIISQKHNPLSHNFSKDEWVTSIPLFNLWLFTQENFGDFPCDQHKQ
jgi:hypothetical protein